MEEKVSSNSLNRILDLSIMFLLGLVVSLRMMDGGQDLNSLYTSFIEICIWLGCFLFIVSKLSANDLSFRIPVNFYHVIFFILAILISVHTASQTADGFWAGLLARHWIFEIVFFILVFNFCATRERCDTLLSVFLACIAILGMFCIYQRFYAIEYFTNVVNSTPGLIENIVGENTTHQNMFMARVRSTRVHGPYGYPNALAGVTVLALPALAYMFFSNLKLTKNRIITGGAVLICLTALLLSGSKAGIASAKAGELLFFIAAKRYYGKFRDAGYFTVFCTYLCTTFLGIAGYVLSLKILSLFSDMSSAYAVVTFALLWLVGVGVTLYVLEKKSGSLLGRAFKLAGVIGLVAVLLVAVLLVFDIQVCSGIDQRIENVRSKAQVNLSVRYNYWVAGARMFLENPVMGVGLDQYGNYYTQYKTISGWAVKRAHNTYLQLLDDGGLVLFAAFIMVWLKFFFVKPDKSDLVRENVFAGFENIREGSRIKTPAMFAMLGAIFMTCFIFRGFHFEFFYNEINGGPFSSWPADKIPAFIHFSLHMFILPVACLVCFYSFWNYLDRLENNRGIWRLLRLGMLILFVHIFFDFHYHMQVISFLVWFLAGIFMAASCGDSSKVLSVKIGRKAADAGIVISVVIFAFIGWWQVFPQWERANLIDGGYNLFRAGDFEKSIEFYQRALEMNEHDSELQRTLSSVYSAIISNHAKSMFPSNVTSENEEAVLRRAILKIDKAERDKVIYHAEKAVECNPQPAANHAYLGRELFKLFPYDKEKLNEAASSFEVAISKHPFKPSYLVWLGRIYTAIGEREKAIACFRKALNIDNNPLLTDKRAKLNDFEKYLCQSVVDNASLSR